MSRKNKWPLDSVRRWDGCCHAVAADFLLHQFAAAAAAIMWPSRMHVESTACHLNGGSSPHPASPLPPQVLLSSEVTKMGDEGAVRGPPDEGVYVHGLFLDGAAWSAREGKLVDAAPKVAGCRGGAWGSPGAQDVQGFHCPSCMLAAGCRGRPL